MLLAILNRTSTREVALRVGVTRSAVYKWVEGETIPTPRAQHLLREIYRVPPEAWLTVRRPLSAAYTSVTVR